RPSSGADAAARIEAWLAAIGIGTRPTVELDPADLASRVTGNLAADPIPATESRLTTIYDEILLRTPTLYWQPVKARASGPSRMTCPSACSRSRAVRSSTGCWSISGAGRTASSS